MGLLCLKSIKMHSWKYIARHHIILLLQIKETSQVIQIIVFGSTEVGRYGRKEGKKTSIHILSITPSDSQGSYKSHLMKLSTWAIPSVRHNTQLLLWVWGGLGALKWKCHSCWTLMERPLVAIATSYYEQISAIRLCSVKLSEIRPSY